MAWVAPRLWVTGEVVTAAKMNEISDSMNQSAPAKAAALGDVFIGSAANTIKKLSLGSTGEVLGVNEAGTDVEWVGGTVGNRFAEMTGDPAFPYNGNVATDVTISGATDM